MLYYKNKFTSLAITAFRARLQLWEKHPRSIYKNQCQEIAFCHDQIFIKPNPQ